MLASTVHVRFGCEGIQETGPTHLPRRRPDSSRGHCSDVNFSLPQVRTFHIRGHVTGGIAAAPPANTNVLLAPKHQTVFMPSATSSEGPKGDFDIPNVPPCSYDLTASASAHAKTLEATQLVQVMDSGVNLVLRPGATLRGRVRAEGPVDLSEIHLALRARGSRPYNYLMSQPRVQGDDRLFAWQKIQPGRDRDPNFRERFWERGQQAQVMEGSTQSFELHAIPASATRTAMPP